MVAPILEVENIKKSYGHVRALDGASLQAFEGQVTALVGDNGAGKSTLIKMLAGAETPDHGEIRFRGEKCHIDSPAKAQELGISTVYQDLAVAPDLTPTDNLYLGREVKHPSFLGRLGFLDEKAMEAAAITEFSNLGVSLKSSTVPIASLSGGQRQSVAIARATLWASAVIILDEPTAALGVVQTERVLDLIDSVRKRGIAVILISHNMPQVLEIADRIEVLRLGKTVDRMMVNEASVNRLVTAMTSGTGEE